VFFAISQFSPNIDVLIFTYGVMGGQLSMIMLSVARQNHRGQFRLLPLTIT